jgi:hypothetical protein
VANYAAYPSSASRALVAQVVRAERAQEKSMFTESQGNNSADAPSDSEEDDLANRLPPVKTHSRFIQNQLVDDDEDDFGDSDQNQNQPEDMSENEGREEAEDYQPEREKSGERI